MGLFGKKNVERSPMLSMFGFATKGDGGYFARKWRERKARKNDSKNSSADD
ncbi:MAG: hypothetical protein JO281_19550 [Pseudonocardiales bacterium]|nr:hypothetical protein [Pseudonocardiales bacterium]